MVEPYAPLPAYRQVANDLRRQITSGQLQPGQTFGSEADLVHRYGIGRYAIRQALGELRAEGLIDTSRGHLPRVRELDTVTAIKVPRGGVVRLRMPTPDERATMHIPEGVPVGELQVRDEVRGVYPGHRYQFIA